MSELTPERIRDAAEVLRQLDSGHAVYRTEYSWTPSQLDRKAAILEREQAEEAKREKRIKELAEEIRVVARRGPLNCLAYVGVNRDTNYAWDDLARALLDRYPALAEVNS